MKSEQSPSFSNSFSTWVLSTPLWNSLDVGLGARPSQATSKVPRGVGDRQVSKNDTLFQEILRAVEETALGDVTRV